MIIQGTKLTGTIVNDGLVTGGLLLYLDSRNPRSWPGSGSTWYDLSGLGNNATFYSNPSKLNNGSTEQNGNVINGNTLGNNGLGDLYFNGTSSSGLYQFAWGPNLGTSLSRYTIMCWVNFASLVSTSEAPAVFNLGDYTGYSGGTTVNGTIAFFNGTSNDGNLHAGFYNSGWNATSGYTVSTGNWYHTVMTYDSATIKFYINNSLLYSTSVSSTISNSLGYRVGRRWDGWDTVDAYIPISMVYNRALSASEISQNFNYHRGRYGV